MSKTINKKGLTFVGNVTVGPLREVFDPKKFLDGENNSVKLFEKFDVSVFASACKVSEKAEKTLKLYFLTTEMYDRENLALLPPKSVFAIEDLWMVEDLIKNDNLIRGRTVLFYFKIDETVFVLRLLWLGSRYHMRTYGFEFHSVWDERTCVISLNG